MEWDCNGESHCLLCRHRINSPKQSGKQNGRSFTGCSMKKLGVLLLPLDGMLVYRWVPSMKQQAAMVTYSFHLYSRSSHHFHSAFHSFHGLMNSINWPALSVWVFIAQAGNANAEATGSNPVEAPKNFFSGYFAIA